MKHLLFLSIFSLVVAAGAFSQNVGIGTTVPVGKLHVVGTKATTQLVIDAYSGQGGAPLVRLRDATGRDLLHLHTNDSTNLFLGLNAGKSSGESVVDYKLGRYNLFLGAEAGRATTTGNYNTAVGWHSLLSNRVGIRNTALGSETLVSGTGSFNIAVGYLALSYVTTGNANIGIGVGALRGIVTGNNNISIGGNDGACSGYGSINNSIVIGNETVLCTQNSNYALFGTQNTVWTGGNTLWSTYSDARIKSDVHEDVVGLPFILKLRPVTYQRSTAALLRLTGREDKIEDYPEKHDIEKMRMTGFLAQEVEKAADDAGYNFGGITKPKTPTDLYSLSYESFVVPLVKAVQEQQAQIDGLKEANANLEKQNQELKARLEKVEKLLWAKQ